MRELHSLSTLRNPLVAFLGVAVLVLGAALISASAVAGSGHGEDQAQDYPTRDVDTSEVIDAVQPAQQADRSGLRVSMDVRGVSRVAKLDAEINVGPGRFDGMIYDTPDEWKDVEGDLSLPPADGYFVVFGFMPTTNTTSFVQDDKVMGKTKLDLVNSRADVDMVARLYLEVSDVKQDGVPLNVGSTCRTAVPAQIPIKGTVNLEPGAESELDEAIFEIPPFRGCGTSENLDPLITGLVSGKGNVLNTTVVMRCIGCPAE